MDPFGGGGGGGALCLSSANASSDPQFRRVISDVSTAIQRTELRDAEADARDQFSLEWKQVSLVIDRVLLLLFFLAMTIASLVILTSSPHLYTWGPHIPITTSPDAATLAEQQQQSKGTCVLKSELSKIEAGE